MPGLEPPEARVDFPLLLVDPTFLANPFARGD
jgi:hypothetical protein